MYHFYDSNEWKNSAKYYLIPTAESLSRLLLERFPDDFFRWYTTRISARNVWLRDSYLEVVFHVAHRFFYLRNVGYTEYPTWQASGRDAQEKWFYERIADQELKQRIPALLNDRR